MEGGDSEFAKFTVPTLKAFLKARSHNVSGNNVCQQAVTYCSCYRMLKKVLLLLFLTNSQSSSHPKNDAKTLFSVLHPSCYIFANATVVAFVTLRNSRLNFNRCMNQRLLRS